MEWYLAVLKNYTGFGGRARRQEYWMFLLFNVIIAFVLGFVEALFGSPGILGMLYSLAVFIPSIAVSMRRLHDTGRSGLWLLIGFVPVLGAIVLLIFFVQNSMQGENQYGSSPK